MPKPQRIEAVRNWTERHAHRAIKLAEDERGRIWLRVDDLRQWLTGLPKTDVLMQRYPGMVRLADASSQPYLEASTFAWLVAKSTDVPTLKLAAWLEASVVGPARNRHRWDAYRGEQGLLAADNLFSLDQHGRVIDPHSTEVKSPLQSSIDPRVWLITRGEWSQRTTLLAGFVGSSVAVVLSVWLEDLGWDVNRDYAFWAWVAIAVALWAVVWNAAWAIGAVRSAIRRLQEGLGAWLAISAMLANLVAALIMATTTLGNTHALLNVWWHIVGKRDKPVSMYVSKRTVSGEPIQLELTGRVGMGSYMALKEALEEHPQVKEILLTSGGGLVVEGFSMTELIYQSEMTTVVTDRCYSVCAIMYLAGQRRLVGQEGRVGFHRSSSILGGISWGWDDTDHLMADWMRERGVNEDFVQAAMDTPSDDIYVVSPADLVNAGVSTEVIEGP